MNEDLIIEETRSYVRSRLEGEGSGHDWWHIVREYNNALDIAKNESNVNIFIVKLGALLHDIADHKFGYSDIDRKDIISNLLNKYELPKEYLDQIIYICNNISFKSGTNNHIIKSIEGKIIQDADRLDAIGAIGIGRAFAYGGYVKREMYNPDLKATNTYTIAHFYEKLFLLKDMMNTETGKRKAKIRYKTMEEYLDMFYKEWDGEV